MDHPLLCLGQHKLLVQTQAGKAEGTEEWAAQSPSEGLPVIGTRRLQYMREVCPSILFFSAALSSLRLAKRTHRGGVARPPSPTIMSRNTQLVCWGSFGSMHSFPFVVALLSLLPTGVYHSSRVPAFGNGFLVC